MNTSFTPGPWTLGKGKVTIREADKPGSDGFIARCHLSGKWRVRSEEEAEANALLIACAPELLEQLIILYDSITQFACGEPWPELTPALKVIHRATGQEP